MLASSPALVVPSSPDVLSETHEEESGDAPEVTFRC